jgi:hypothetical protein
MSSTEKLRDKLYRNLPFSVLVRIMNKGERAVQVVLDYLEQLARNVK